MNRLDLGEIFVFSGRKIGESWSCNSIIEQLVYKFKHQTLIVFLFAELRLHVSEGSIFDCHDISNPAIQQHYRALEV